MYIDKLAFGCAQMTFCMVRGEAEAKNMCKYIYIYQSLWSYIKSKQPHWGYLLTDVKKSAFAQAYLRAADRFARQIS